MPVIDNVYAFSFYVIAIILVVIVLLIVIIYSVKQKVNFRISRDGFSYNTPSGKSYIESDYSFRVNNEIEKKKKRIYVIENREIIELQMRYLERELDEFYDTIYSYLNHKTVLEEKLLDHHRYLSLDYFRDEVIKKNHFVSRYRWEEYKRQIEKVSYITLRKFWDDMIKDLEKENIIIETLFDYQSVKEKYDQHFFIWMDEFKEIAKIKYDEICKINQDITKLNLLLGHKTILET